MMEPEDRYLNDPVRTGVCRKHQWEMWDGECDYCLPEGSVNYEISVFGVNDVGVWYWPVTPFVAGVLVAWRGALMSTSAEEVIASGFRFYEPDKGLREYAASGVLQALADAGYTVARLEQIGWQDAEDDVWTYADYDGDPPRPSDRPVYRIVGSSE